MISENKSIRLISKSASPKINPRENLFANILRKNKSPEGIRSKIWQRFLTIIKLLL